MQRSLNHLRALGYWPEITEYNLKRPGMRAYKRDLFHCMDILAAGEGYLLGVQATDITSISTRLRKIQSLPEFEIIKRAAPGLRFEVHGWDGPRVRIVDAMTMETISDNRILGGRSSKASKHKQIELI